MSKGTVASLAGLLLSVVVMTVSLSCLTSALVVVRGGWEAAWIIVACSIAFLLNNHFAARLFGAQRIPDVVGMLISELKWRFGTK